MLSKGALKKFVTQIMHNGKLCSQSPEGNEDYEIGKCLEHLAISADERDDQHEKRFFPIGISDHVKPRKNFDYWYDQSQYYEVNQGNISCCSDVPVAFHYVSQKEMYTLEYFIMKVHPFGITRSLREDLPKKLSLQEIFHAADVESPSMNYRKHLLYHKVSSSEVYRRRRSSLFTF